MLGEFSWEHQADGRLNLPTAERGFLVVRRKLSSLLGNATKDIVDERIHNRHALFGDTGIGVDLWKREKRQQQSYW